MKTSVVAVDADVESAVMVRFEACQGSARECRVEFERPFSAVEHEAKRVEGSHNI